METATQNIEIEIDDRTADGDYANLAMIAHSESEFVLDFAAIMPGVTKARVKSRVILAPEHAKRLLLSLEENITRYETTVGRIELHDGGMPALTDENLVASFIQGEA